MPRSKTGEKKNIREDVHNVVAPKTEYSKEQILVSTKYANRRDLVDALLDDKKKYTMETVDNMIESFMKGKVK